MKMKGFWKKVIAKVLTAVMIVSIFSTVDMGWNVSKVQAAGYVVFGDMCDAYLTANTNLVLQNGDTLTHNGNKDSRAIQIAFDPKGYNEMYTFIVGDRTTGALRPGETSTIQNLPCRIKLYSLPSSDMNFIFKMYHDWQSATCTTVKKCRICGTTEGSVLGHSWKTTYTWSADGKSCTATRTCSRDSNHNETETASISNSRITSKVKTAATCTTKGTTTYTAKFNNTAFATQTKDFQDINAFGHTFTYSANDNIITAKCSRDASHTATLTLNASNSTYDGSPKSASIVGWTPNLTQLASIPSIAYKQGETLLSGAPTNVGDYTASITVDTATATKDFSIAKSALNAGDFDFIHPEEPIVYDGNPKPAEIELKPGKPGTGNITKKYQKKKDNDTWEDIDDEPTDAGTYRVVVSVEGGDNYGPIPELTDDSWKFTITQATLTIDTEPTVGTPEISYGTPLKDIPITGGVVKDKDDNIIHGRFEWKEGGIKPEVSDSNTTDFIIVFIPDDENYAPVEHKVKLIVNKAAPEAPTKGVGYIIDYVNEKLKPASDTDFEIGIKTGDGNPVAQSSPVSLTSYLDSPSQTVSYYVRYKENSNQSSSDWTAITIPARPAAPNAVGKQETVMNKKDAAVTGVNTTMEYRFDGGSTWMDVTGNSVPNPDNKTIFIRVKASADKNFHGIETDPITFTPSDTKLKINVGGNIVEVAYGEKLTKPADPTGKEDETFKYWSYNGVEWDFDTPVTEEITLTAVFWHKFHGTITAKDYSKISRVRLEDGYGRQYESQEFSFDPTTGTGEYTVSAPAGVDYNLVIDGIKKIKGEEKAITKTQLINLEKNGGDANMPAGAFSSKVNKLDAGENYKNTLVGGLDEIADKHAERADEVVVELKVSENVAEDNKNKISDVIKGKTLDFVDLTLTKTVNGLEEAAFGDTNEQILEIIIPYQTANKYNIEVYRHHGDKVDTLTTTAKDGEYIVVGKNTITIHAKKFSTYAIGYADRPSNWGSGSSDDAKKPGTLGKEVYRLYNPKSRDHLLTVDELEKDVTSKAGWTYEGVAFIVSDKGKKVYRLFNPRTGEHFYTTNELEKNVCVSNGWVIEGIAFTTDGTKEVYRLFGGGMHLFTTSVVERDHLISLGWKYEGVEFMAN